jgi:tetratricopeptide (TPR) repeat protein
VSAGLKRLVYASFVLSFGFTFLALHGESPAASYAPIALSGPVYQLLPLGIPALVVAFSMNAFAAVYALVLLALAVELRRRASARDVAPAALLIGTQALWFSAPALARQWGVLEGLLPFSIQRAEYAFIWIAIGHSVQYLWITAYYARVQGRSSSHTRFFLKSLVAGMAIWTLPTLLFAPGVLGRLPYDAGLGVLVASMVNIHHFVLDGVIWKLRDGRVARVLLRAREEVGAELRSRLRLVGWALVSLAGAVSIVVTVLWLREDVYAYHPSLARGDLERAELAVERLAWLGRDNPGYRHTLAARRSESGDLDAAHEHLAASLALQPSARAWLLRGNLYETSEAWAEAADAYQRAAALRPEAPVAFYRLGMMRLALGHVHRAGEAFGAALDLAPENPAYRQAVEQVEEAIAESR